MVCQQCTVACVFQFADGGLPNFDFVFDFAQVEDIWVFPEVDADL